MLSTALATVKACGTYDGRTDHTNWCVTMKFDGQNFNRKII